MDFPAAPQPGRRVSIGSAVVLAGYLLLAPPLFVLAPFVLLTLASRPRAARELFWLVAAGVGVGLALQGPGGLVVDLLRASGLVLGPVFLVLSLRWRGPLFGRALLAVLLTAVSVGIWEWARGIGWPELYQTFTALLQDSYREWLKPAAGAQPNADLQTVLQPLIDGSPLLARALPGMLAIQGLAGAALAWSWHHKLAEHPLGQPPGPFHQFRFNDHLVWGAIFTLASLLAPLPDPWIALAESLLVLWIGLYGFRGLAIAAAALRPAPLSLKVVAVVLALLLFPVAAGLFLALGLADTWLDIRGRLAPPAPGGA